jgi:hypothetical protein
VLAYRSGIVMRKIPIDVRRASFAGGVFLALWAGACGPKKTEAVVVRAPSEAEQRTQAFATAAPMETAPAPRASAQTTALEAPVPDRSVRPGAETFEGATFPPADVVPPFERTAAPGDGHWTVVADRLGDGVARMARTRLHNHPVRRDKYVDVVAIDRAAVELELVVGKEEPEANVAPERRTGLVPEAHREGLLAAFNGGFMQRHGKWGMMKAGDVFTPPREDGCTIAHRTDGRLVLATWSALDARESMDWWRQTPPCLVENGELPAKLLREPGSGLWGRSIEGQTDIRRSALALDASRRVLFYVFSEWNNANELAQALRVLGAKDAAELDINWSYTRFFWFEHPAGAPPHLGEALVPKLDFDRRRYVEKPAERDFFYLRRRSDPAR